MPAIDEVPFSSSLRWSAVEIDAATWVLDTPDTLASSLQGPDLTADVRAHTTAGLRSLIFARANDPATALR